MVKIIDPEFYEARAITLSRMGQHRQALEIYVFKLQDPQKAEESVAPFPPNARAVFRWGLEFF